MLMQRRKALPWLAFLSTLGWMGFLSRYGVDLHHDGVVLKPALDVASGMTLFRDTFSQYGPLSSWLLAVPVAVFGPSLWAIKCTAVVFYALTAWVLAAMWGRLLPTQLTALALGLWLALSPDVALDRVFQAWPSVFALLFQCGSILAVLRALSGVKSAAWLLASGVGAALCLATRQPVGGLLGLAAGGVLLLRAFLNRRWRAAWVDLAAFCAGGALTLAAVGAILWIQGALPAWYQQNVVWPSEWAKAWFGTSPERVLHYLIRNRVEVRVLLPVLLGAGWVLPGIRKRWGARAAAWAGGVLGTALFFRFPLPTYSAGALTLVPLASAVLTPWLLWRGRHRGWRHPALWIELGIGVAVLASWAQFYPVNDSRHVYWAITPALGFFVWQLHQWLGNDERVTRNVVGVWLLSVVLSQGQAAWHKLSQNHQSIDDPVLRGLRIESGQAQALRPVVQKLRELTESGRPIWVEGPDVFYTLFTRNPSHPGPLAMIWPLGSLKRTHFDAQGVQLARHQKPVLVYQTERLDPPGVWPPLPQYQKEYEGPDPWYGSGKPISVWATP
jgi:hypothetical protein